MRDAPNIFDRGRSQVRPVLLAARLVFVAAQAAILWGVFTKNGGGVQVLPWDKAEHFVAFLGLMLLALPAFPARSTAVLALALAVEGGMIEVIQAAPMVGRDSDVGDWVADLAGILSVIAAMLVGHLRLWLRQECIPTTRSNLVAAPEVAADD
jgi:VanZ family protein